jgi:hypothetical protein
MSIKNREISFFIEGRSFFGGLPLLHFCKKYDIWIFNGDALTGAFGKIVQVLNRSKILYSTLVIHTLLHFQICPWNTRYRLVDFQIDRRYIIPPWIKFKKTIDCVLIYQYGTKGRHKKFVRVNKNRNKCLKFSILLNWIEISIFFLYWGKIS